jgi:outer membrane PBP1 activator LpoA protein
LSDHTSSEEKNANALAAQFIAAMPSKLTLAPLSASQVEVLKYRTFVSSSNLRPPNGCDAKKKGSGFQFCDSRFARRESFSLIRLY